MASTDFLGTIRALNAKYVQRYPREAARALEGLDPEEIAAFLEEVSPERAAELLQWISPDAGAEALHHLGDDVVHRVLPALDPARAAALLARLDVEKRDAYLDLLDAGAAAEIRELLAYPVDSAGHLMDPRFASLRPENTVADALRRLQQLRGRRVQDVFLIDEEGRLIGAVALQDVALAAPESALGTLARGTLASVQATAGREEILETFRMRGVGSLPVVDYDGRILGVLRQQAILDAAEQEATADLLTMVGASKDERALSPPLFAVRKRLPWLEINLGTAFLAAGVVGLFEDTIAKFTALAVLLPVVAGQSGNTGSQALAVTMRGLALREVRMRHWFQVARKEIAVAAINGLAVAATTALGVFLWSRSPGLTLVIAVSMILSMVIAGMAGAAIPMVLTAVGQDPAQSSSIILTTVTDVVGFMSFLGIATLLSSML